MRASGLVLGLLLVTSVAANAVLMSRLRTPAPDPVRGGAPAISRGSDPAIPVPPSSDPALMAQIVALRSEVAELRRQAGIPGSGSASNPPNPVDSILALQDPGITASSNPKVSETLAAGEKMDQLWKGMGRLSAGLKADELKLASIDFAADMIGISGDARAAFSKTAQLALADLEKANLEYREALKRVPYDKANPQMYNENQKLANARLQEATKAADEQIKSVLPKDTAVQRRFVDSVMQWAGYLTGSSHRYGGSKEYLGN